MKTFLNGTVTLNLSVLTEMSVGESKIKLHPETLVGGKFIFKLANGQEIAADINEYHEIELDAIDENGIIIHDADFAQ